MQWQIWMHILTLETSRWSWRMASNFQGHRSFDCKGSCSSWCTNSSSAHQTQIPTSHTHHMRAIYMNDVEQLCLPKHENWTQNLEHHKNIADMIDASNATSKTTRASTAWSVRIVQLILEIPFTQFCLALVYITNIESKFRSKDGDG